jgi:large subunit ribosomal protein L30
MSSKQKRKAKPKAQRKERPKPVRKPPHVPEEKKREVAPERKVPKAIPEVEEKPLLLAVRLMGAFGTPKRTEVALQSLRLDRRYRAVLLEKNGSTLGTLRAVKDYVTWGEVKSAVIADLLRKRAELANGMEFSDKFVKENLGQESTESLAHALTSGQLKLSTLWQRGIQPVFRLRAPSKGFEGGIKRPFGSRGELGYRGAEISSLVERMM